MNYRSHTQTEIEQAIKTGQKVWYLDTDGDGEDDHLIGEYDEVVTDILYFFDIEELPGNWSLYKIN